MKEKINLQEVADVLTEEHGARMTRKHKSLFREWVTFLAKEMGYSAKIEDCFLAKNVVVGNPKKAKIVLTAHYDTPPNLPYKFIMKQLKCAGIGLPTLVGVNLLVTNALLKNGSKEAVELALMGVQGSADLAGLAMIGLGGLAVYSMGFLGGENQNNYDDNSSGVLTLIGLMDYYKNLPPEKRDEIAFVFFDNEEKGLVGSLCYSAKHRLQKRGFSEVRQIKNQAFINYDCVGVGKRVNVIYTGNVKKEFVKDLVKEVEKMESKGYKTKAFRTTMNSMSDHLAFNGSLGNVTILCDDENDPVVNHIHSGKDDLLKLSNVEDIIEMSARPINKILEITDDMVKDGRVRAL